MRNRPNRRAFMKTLTLGTSATFLSPSGFGKEPASKQPNIVIFLVDDMGLMDTSVPMLTDEDGSPKRHPLNEWYRTPNMERMVDMGVRFSNFYAHSVCSPTRIGIMTGQNSARHGTTTWINPTRNNKGEFGPPDWDWTGLRKGAMTLPGLLQEEGYKTIHVGKAHFGPKNHEGADPTNLGFDINIGGTYAGRPESYRGQDAYGNDKDALLAVPHLEEYHNTDTYLTEALTREANKEIASTVEAGKPFFLNMSHYAVHSPFQSDPRFATHYKDSGKSKRAQAYATMIEGVDKSLGDIMEQLKRLGVAENTLIIFLGDNGSDGPLGDAHGYSSSAPLLGKKGTHHEGGVRVPFIAAWASPDPNNPWQKKLPIAAGEVQPQMGTILDILPTVCFLVEVDMPNDYVIDGFDLKKQLAGHRNVDRSETFLNHFPHRHRSSYFSIFINEDWKVVYHYPVKGKPRYELYNLKRDPYEKNNLANEEPERLRGMIKEMAADMKAKNTLYPVAEGDRLTPILP